MESEVRISHENELASNPEPPSSSGETVRTDNSESVRKKYLITKNDSGTIGFEDRDIKNNFYELF